METTLLLSKPTFSPPHQPPHLQHSLSSLTLTPTTFHLPSNHRHHHPLRHRSTTIKSAISRTKKELTVQTVQTHLENCYLIAAINYKGFTVKQFQELRRTLPPSTTLIVAKNTLVYKAVENTPWEVIKPCMTGMNAWLFVHTEEIPVALKPYRTFLKEKKLEDKNDFTGAAFEGKFYGPEDVGKLETLPSRAEVYGQLLGALKAPSTNLVVTLQAPARDLVLTLMAYVKKLEDEQQS